MTLTRALVASILACAAACSVAAGRPAPEDITTTAPVFAPARSVAQLRAQRSGLIRLAALRALPPGDRFADVPGYPGRGFHMGTIDDAATFAAVTQSGGWTNFAAIDFSREQVAYLILDAQTNALEFSDWTIGAGGKATLTVEWSGIEPFYVEETPAVLAVIPRGAASTIDFAARPGGAGAPRVLGSIAVP